ncbi:MAG TPA: SRPBCC domain-containing protein [Salegentibacter sp.]|nr:SRPBCC domain-containing protein [Salegentibacter sp.]
MERKNFTVVINAPRENVWEVLWSDETYPKWTATFSEGSRAESDWKEGSKVYFLNAEGEGMVALIDKRKDPEIMNFKHLGMIDKNGNEDLESEKVKPWAGSMENYLLEKENGKTQLTVNMDLNDEYKDYFLKTWPKALEKIKELAENDHQMNDPINISTKINAPIGKVWEVWNAPEHIENWNAASDDWHTKSASNDLRKGGKISSRMEAKDGSAGFDFEGIYDDVKPREHLAYTLTDGRKVSVNFKENGNSTLVEESFEAESENSRELQQQGWQAILDNFKKYVEQGLG